MEEYEVGEEGNAYLTSGQSYKQFTLVNYDPSVLIYERKMFIRLATDSIVSTNSLPKEREIFFNWAHPGLFWFIFVLFTQQI